MRSILRTAAVVSAAVTLALGVGGTAHATEGDVTEYTPADWSVTPKASYAGIVSWKTVGDNLYIKDAVADGHSVVGILLEVPGLGDRYYWNSGGAGTTRAVYLDLPEGTPVVVMSCLGDFQGTPTGGIMWDHCSDPSQGHA